jgi:hypothetical protein
MAEPTFVSEREHLRTELAAAAARLIAEEDFDYATAKQKAAEQVLGAAAARGLLPDNAAIENQLRQYLALFVPDHAETLRALRELALRLMRQLESFNPHLVGAVLNGTATRFSNIHLHLFVDDVKSVEMFLLNQSVEFDVADSAPAGAAPLERLLSLVRPVPAPLANAVGLVLDLFDTDAIRVAPKYRSSADGLHPIEAAGRADAGALARLLAERR